jgi:hypothetical protein
MIQQYEKAYLFTDKCFSNLSKESKLSLVNTLDVEFIPMVVA